MLFELLLILSIFAIRAISQCTVCPVNCNPIVWYYSDDPNSCATLNSSKTLERFDNPACTYGAFEMICAGFKKVSDYNRANNCSVPSPKMCRSWCDQMQACTVAPLPCSNTAQWAPTAPCVNVTLEDVVSGLPEQYTPSYLPYCPTVLDRPSDPSVIKALELGPLATIYQDPGFPPIPQVHLPHKSFADLFDPKCSAMHGSVQRHGFVGFFIFFVIFVSLTLALFIWRRDKWPIRSREPFLVTTFIFFDIVLYLLFTEYEVYGTTAQCDILYVAALIGGPLFFAPMMLRAFRLVFLYRWNSSKVKNHARDWYFDHRWLISNQTMAIVLTVNAIVCSLMAVMVLQVSGESAHGTILATGRCSWWYFSPEVVAYAQNTYNLTLTDQLLNAYGIGPYSVVFESCQFCRLVHGLPWFILIWNYIFIVFLLGCTFFLRNINDQYWLWREFMLTSVVNIFLFPLTIAAVTPEGGKAFGIDGKSADENDFIGIVVAIVVLWNYICVVVIPLILTFTRSAKDRVQTERELSTSPRSVSQPFYSVNPKQSSGADKPTKFNLFEVDKDGTLRVVMDVDEVLSDPVGEQCLRNFAVELFKAELVEFYIQARAYQELHDREQMRIMASKLYFTYIAEGSPLQINVSHKTREKYDRLARDGVFDESQMVEHSAEGDVFNGFKKPTTPQQEKLRLVIPKASLEMSKREETEKVEKTDEDSSVPRALTREVSEGQPSMVLEDGKNLIEDGKAISDDSQSTKFHAVDFNQPIKEVKNLLRDDWLRFQQSHHWTIFHEHLVKISQVREQSPVTDFDERRHSHIQELSVTDTDAPQGATTPRNASPTTPRNQTPTTPRNQTPTTPRHRSDIAHSLSQNPDAA